MSRRLKVLISAYACEPGKGSEPEVGWQWALQMARFHDVVVLTRENNRGVIEAELEKLRGSRPLPSFAYYDCGAAAMKFKGLTRAVKWYYVLWQRSAHEIVRQLHQTHHFDLMHHVTFAGFRYRTAIWDHGVPSLWGPIGGIEYVPCGLLPWTHPSSLFAEVSRGVHSYIQAAPHMALARRAARSTTILASTPEMKKQLVKLGFQATLMPTIGLDFAALPCRKRAENHTGPLRLLYVGNIITLKGIDLVLHALAQSGTDATLTLIGDGNFRPACERLAERLGLSQRVKFRGRMPREEVLRIYPEFDVFVFPSLHDTGGYAVIEAMFNELPVICLDCGGPSVAVTDGSGIKVPLGRRSEVITRLAAAIRQYVQGRNRVLEEGRNARASVMQNYEWERKGEAMNRIYLQTANEKTGLSNQET